MKKKILLRGPVLTRSGYGEQARFALRSLRSREDLFDIYIQPLQWGKTSWLNDTNEEREWIDETIEKTIHYVQQGGHFDISLQVTIPNEFQKLAPVNIGSVASDLFDVGIAGFSYGGMTYGVPYATEAIAMYYNADLVDSVPATWDDVKAACDAAGTELCVGAPGGGGGGDAYHNHPFFASAGGYIFKFDAGFDPSDVGLDNEGALASAEYLDGLVKDGVVASTDYGASMSAFQEGRSVFWMTGPWARNDASAVNYGVGLIPAFGDSAATPFVGVRGAMVSAFSEKKLLAESFILDFFVTVEVQEAMYNSDPRLPATKSLFAIVEAADPIAAQFAASAANGIPMPNIPEMGSVWGPVGDALLIIRDQAYGTNEETGVTVNSATDAMKLAAEQVRTAIAGG